MTMRFATIGQSSRAKTTMPILIYIFVTLAFTILQFSQHYTHYFLTHELSAAIVHAGKYKNVSTTVPSGQINQTGSPDRSHSTNITVLPPPSLNNNTATPSHQGSANILAQHNNIATAQPMTSESQRDSISTITTKGTIPKTKLVGNGEWNDDGARFQVTPEQEHLFQTWEDGKGSATTCPWNRNESHISRKCMDLLGPIAQNVRRWYFLGDSTMARPWQWCMVPKLENRSQILRRAKGHGVKDYLGISKEETLTELKATNFSRGEGPSDYPTVPYQSGCSTCENRLIKFQQRFERHSNEIYPSTVNASLSSFAYAEFLTMEFARDVEYASKSTDTTQESIARYMKRQRQSGGSLGIPKNQTACVISSGMHDILIPNMTSEVYISNHIAMKQLLKNAGCDIWIKLELTARGFRGPDVENNDIIFEWNEGIKRSMAPDEYQIDLFFKSLSARHADGVHMDVDSFYCPLADFFIELMGVAENPNS